MNFSRWFDASPKSKLISSFCNIQRGIGLWLQCLMDRWNLNKSIHSKMAAKLDFLCTHANYLASPHFRTITLFNRARENLAEDEWSVQFLKKLRCRASGDEKHENLASKELTEVKLPTWRDYEVDISSLSPSSFGRTKISTTLCSYAAWWFGPCQLVYYRIPVIWTTTKERWIDSDFYRCNAVTLPIPVSGNFPESPTGPVSKMPPRGRH